VQHRKGFLVVLKNRNLSLYVVDQTNTSNLNQHKGIEAEFTNKILDEQLIPTDINHINH